MARKSVPGKNPPPCAWNPCPQGKFSDLAEKLDRRRQRRIFFKSVGAAAGVAAFGGLALWFAWPRELACSDFQQLAMEWESLTPSERDQVRQHVSHCTDCQSRLRESRLKQIGINL